jgi:GGDEF domain-containing protein
MGALGAAVRRAHTRTVVDPDAQLDIAAARTMIEDLVEAADCAMYEAKRTGGNQARGARRDSLERCV